MTQVIKISMTICALFFALLYAPLALATGHARHAIVHKTPIVKSLTKNNKRKKIAKVTATSGKKTLSHPQKIAMRQPLRPKCTLNHKTHKKNCLTIKSDDTQSIASAYKNRVQKARTVALNTLMDQIGKPYRWGGSSPRTGFDCSGLVYYAYKNLVKFRIPRTANEMYHLRDAALVDRSELEKGDLVFFRTEGRGAADHVGVYVGNDKFIQSPRTGRDIQISSLSNVYWQSHYVGARRVMTADNLR